MSVTKKGFEEKAVSVFEE